MEAMYEEAEVRVMEEVESCCTLVDLPLPKKKKRSKGSGDHTDKPKKPRSAYLLYYFDVHQRLQQEHPDMPQSEINKRISDSWKRLNVADKGFYLERARMEKDGLDPSVQSAVSSRDVPGFRKILPRTNYVLLPKTSLDEGRTGASVEVCVEDGVDSADEESSKASAQEGLVSPLTLGSEVELAEQCVGVGDDTAMSLGRSTAFQGLFPQCSSARRLPAFVQDRQQCATLLKEEETRAVGGAYGGVGMAVEGLEGGAVLPQVKADATHLVAIIPSHELLENKVLPAASPVMMLPVLNRVRAESKPSFKLSIKYTRRGRGSCSTPGCSFTYVTRHKPPQCPDCGQHLGGKWVAPVVKGVVPGAASSPRKQQKSQDDEVCSAAPPSEMATRDTVLPFVTDAGHGEATENTTEKAAVHAKAQDVSPAGRSGGGPSRTMKRTRRKREKTDAVTAHQPTDGALVNNSDASQCTESAVIGVSSARVRVIGKDKSITSGQKRRIRAILPAPSSPTVFQWITVPPNRSKRDAKVTRTGKPSAERTLGLKPSTLKQLGHSVPPSASEQKPTAISSNQYIVTESGVKILSMLPFKQNSTSSLALGLSTARGRGRCKNPSCDYIYKNRHKPAFCPSCGCELSSKPSKRSNSVMSLDAGGGATPLLDVVRGLTAGQREVQRQSTVALLRHCLHFPESEAELQDTLDLVHRLNRTRGSRHAGGDQPPHTGEEQQQGEEEEEESVCDGWPTLYEPPATHCSLCHYPLYSGGEGCSVAGLQQCWLLTESLLQPVSLQLKTCLNVHCLAVHSFIDLHPGLFNVGNQLLVSLDLFFKIRSQVRLGQEPSLTAHSILSSTHTPAGCPLGPEERARVQQLLCSGYWAFECLTVRDYNDMICGVCGIAPKLEIAQRYTSTVLQLKNVEFTWPEFQASEEVQVEEFWLAMEGEALEQAAFPSSVSITRFDASIIAPFFPPLMRSAVVVNTEKEKIAAETPHAGDASALMRLIRDGQLRPEQMEQHSEEELRNILEQCGTPSEPYSSKDELMVSVCLLYSQIQNGLSTGPRPPSHLTAGKLSKVCPHQVVCGSKYLVRGESARDHVDLLLSSRFWPPVYVADCGQQVALCTEALYPELAAQMWGRRQGCFSDPEATAEYVSCPELQDQHYSVDLSAVDSTPHLHPITKSSSRWIACPARPSESRSPSSSTPHSHRTLTLCRELQPYATLVSSLTGDSSEEGEGPSGPDAPHRQPLVFDNAAHYYLYNRLVDFLHSRDVVSQQMAEVLGVCQQGEVVMIRDALYRLGVAQLNTEEEEPEEAPAGQEEGGAEVDADAVEDAVLE
ncbi:HMG domain-containing protein 3 isoform X2 [Brachyhypopomus gauderio]|uniref:HMG domain-containing protein 3 isoform X2 n=1 Tax=Brachyhypopomus gauderio TaxID=698409 RepID=UPI0040419ABD